MEWKEKSNLTFGIWLSMLPVLLIAIFFLFYKVMIAELINNDLNMENLMLYKEKKELIKELEQKEKQIKEKL